MAHLRSTACTAKWWPFGNSCCPCEMYAIGVKNISISGAVEPDVESSRSSGVGKVTPAFAKRALSEERANAAASATFVHNSSRYQS